MEHGSPIRVAAKRTGLSPHLIRMWERRYAAVEPRRTETGRRLYTDNEIERLTLLRRATMDGQAISQIARLSDEQLRALVPSAPLAADSLPGPRDRMGAEFHLNLCLEAVRGLDAPGLETHLLRASVHLGQQAFVDQLLHPLLELTGEMWSDGRLQVAHEHLASAVIRSLLGSMHLSGPSAATAPLLLGTTPSGQQHEFGVLMALVTAASVGWRTLYLGPNLPAEDIVVAARVRQAVAVALSLVYPSDDLRTTEELRKLRLLGGEGIHLLVGGRSASSYERMLAEIGAIRIRDLLDLRSTLDQIRQYASKA